MNACTLAALARLMPSLWAIRPKAINGLRCSESVAVWIARGEDQAIQDVLFDAVIHIQLVDHLSGLGDPIEVDHGLYFFLFGSIAGERSPVLLDLGIVDHRFEHEAVHLRFGKVGGAFLLHTGFWVASTMKGCGSW